MTEKILTIDIGASKVRFQTVDRKGDSSEMHTVNLVGLELSNQTFLKLLVDNIYIVLENERKDKIAAISIGSPGPLNPQTGVIETPPNLKGILNFPIVEELTKAFRIPVFLLNDADAALLGEVYLRQEQNLKDAVYITLSTGVGSGILKDGKLNGEKIELGHQPLTIENDSRICSCGGPDHAEAYLGTNGLALTYSKVFGINSDIKPEEKHLISPRMREGVNKNESSWITTQEIYARHLTTFLEKIYKDLEPEIIILGGGIIFENKELFTQVSDRLHKLLPDKHASIELAKSKNNVNLGAAYFAFSRLRKD